MRKSLFALFFSVFCLVSFAQSDNSKQANVRLIRNASLAINYAGHKILVDPMLLPKGAIGSVRGIHESPMVDLIVSPERIVQNTELVLVTHNHPDHFDNIASATLPKSIKLINQPADEAFFLNEGFTNAQTLYTTTVWNNISITRTHAQHGTGRMLNEMGESSGYVLQATGQPTIYIVGDAVWTEEINQNIKNFKPDYIIVNSGGAAFIGFEATPIIMDAAQTMALIQESGDATVIAVHMDVIDHCLTTREVLKEAAKNFKIDDSKLLIPEDGELIELK